MYTTARVQYAYRDSKFLSHELAHVTSDKTLIATLCKSDVSAPYKRHQDAGAIFGAKLRASGSAKRLSLSLHWIYEAFNNVGVVVVVVVSQNFGRKYRLRLKSVFCCEYQV